MDILLQGGDYDAISAKARSALDCVLFQPKIDLKTYQFCGVEALSRWHRDQETPPWLDHKTTSDVTEDVDAQCQAYDYVVISAVIDSCSAWSPATRSRIGHVSVNITGPTLSSLWFAPLIKRYLSSRALPRITIELTETFRVTNDITALKTMASLTRYGVSFSVDDFLTGFNQKELLSRLPFQELKIDQLDVRNLSSSAGKAHVMGLIDAAGAPGAIVVAEGIENESQLTIAAALGCDHGQGHWISQPLTEADLLFALARLEDHPWPMGSETTNGGRFSDRQKFETVSVDK